MRAVISITKYSAYTLKWIEYLQHIFLIALRLWLAKVFFMSGLTKIQSWDTTLMLFEYEYAVPYLPFELAAWLATVGELIIPVFLVLGLLTRMNVVALFMLNFVAAISYPDISSAGEKDHLIWGLMAIVLFFYGAGSASVDFLLKTKLGIGKV